MHSIVRTLLALGLALAAFQPGGAAPLNPNTQWFNQAGCGAFIHFLPHDPETFGAVEAFDVDALAAQLHSSGAKYLILTLGQNSGYFNSPNSAYDNVTGYAAGERCARRDLPLDLSQALRAKGIRLMLYLPCQPPNQDARAQRAFGLPEGKQDQPLNPDAARKWATVIQEWSDRYGSAVAGWWFDGAYQNVRFNEEIAQGYAAAAKHGNPAAIVTFNPGVRVIHYTSAEDYTAGELNEPLNQIPSSRWLGQSQWHGLTFLGSNWGQRDTRYSDAQWAAWARATAANGGVITLDMGPNYNRAQGPVGSLAEAQLRQMRVVSDAFLSVQGQQAHRASNSHIERAGPWDLPLLAQPPAWSTLERPKAAGVKAITFEGPVYRGKPTRVFAWLGVPQVKAGQKVPAMVLIHGGGGTAFEEWVRLWVERGYAAIAMDTCGQLPVGTYGRWFRNEQGGPPGWGGLDQIRAAREDQWTYHAVADAILAHSLIRSLPEVDAERTGVTGISWGGYLTCIVAGVDRRFKLAVPVYGCGYYRSTIFDGELKRLPLEDADKWMAWWDPSTYLPDANLPMLWVTGSNDFAYPFDALQLSYRVAPGPRALAVRLRMPHGHGGAGENPEEIRVFADHIFKGGPGLPVIKAQARDGRKAWASFESNVPVVRAELNYTKDTGRWQNRTWDSIPAQLSNGQVTGELPEGARVYYFNLFDERHCVASSEHELCAP